MKSFLSFILILDFTFCQQRREVVAVVVLDSYQVRFVAFPGFLWYLLEVALNGFSSVSRASYIRRKTAAGTDADNLYLYLFIAHFLRFCYKVYARGLRV